MAFKSLKAAWDKWRAQQEENYFKCALRYESETPPQVRRQLEAQGYAYKCQVVPGGGGESYCWYEIDTFKGQSVRADRALLAAYEEERKRLVCAHFKKESPAP